MFGLFTGGQSALWATVVYLVHAWSQFDWLKIPFVPMSVMGIAVSFYVGFKNNSAYDRLWEGRNNVSDASAEYATHDIGADGSLPHRSTR